MISTPDIGKSISIFYFPPIPSNLFSSFPDTQPIPIVNNIIAASMVAVIRSGTSVDTKDAIEASL